MKLRHALAVLAALAAVVPIGAQAGHCDVPIFVFSSTRIQTDVDDPNNPGTPIGRTLPSVTSSAIGCTVMRDIVLASDDPHEATDTDIVYPGSNRLSVRFLAAADPAVITSATLDWAGQVIPLALVQGTDPVTGGPAAWLDSQSIVIDSADTLLPNTATATICTTDAECFTRVYRTVA